MNPTVLMTMILMLLSLAVGQHEFVCGGLDSMGRGELGDAPNWAIPYCTADAEQTEKTVAESIGNFLFMQSYEVLLDQYGATLVAADIQSMMESAGYTQVSNEMSGDTAMTLFVNSDTKTSYIVLLREKEIDYYLLLIKQEM